MAVDMNKAKVTYTREQWEQAKNFLTTVDPATEQDTVLVSVAAFFAARGFITGGQVGLIIDKLANAERDAARQAELVAKFASAGIDPESLIQPSV